MTDKEREAWQALLTNQQAVVSAIQNLLNPLPGTEPTILSASTKWPPKGIVVEARYSKPSSRWVLRYSGGDGYFSQDDTERGWQYDEWRYPPAPWHLAPEWAAQWFVHASGASGWNGTAGYERSEDILYVENRPEVDR